MTCQWTQVVRLKTCGDIWGALRNLVSFVQLKKREDTHGEVLLLKKLQALLKVTLLHGCFSRFLN